MAAPVAAGVGGADVATLRPMLGDPIDRETTGGLPARGVRGISGDQVADTGRDRLHVERWTVTRLTML